MAFIPIIGEAIGTLGAFIAGETGSSAIGTVVGGTVANEANKIAGSAAESAVDALFGAGTSEKLEEYLNSLYNTTKTLGSDLQNLKETGNVNRDQITKLKDDRDKFNGEPIVKAVTEFSKDFSHLVSTGNYNALDSTNNIVIENNQQTLNGVLATLAKVNPIYSYLASKFVGSLSDFVIPTNSDYLKVSSIYTGEGLYDQMMETEDYGNYYEFSMIDESGIRQVWKYPEYNNYTVIPAIFGTWVGINSPNNTVCLSGTKDGKVIESFLDKIAFMHDVGYHDLGSFNATSDYQLISRAKFGKDNNLFIFPGEPAVASTTIAYFSTLGSVMRRVFGNNEIESLKNTPLIQEIVKEIHGVELKSEEIITLKQDAVTSIKQSGTRYGSSMVGSNNFALSSAINNLEIELN